MIVEAGGDGIIKIVERFIEEHPEVPKRQIEIKINEMAYKEKRANDSKPTWYLKTEFEQYLAGSSSAGASSTKEGGESSSKSKTPKKRKLEKEEDGQPQEGDSREVKEPKKFKRAFGLYVRDHRDEADQKLGDIEDVSMQTIYLKNFPLIFLPYIYFYRKPMPSANC